MQRKIKSRLGRDARVDTSASRECSVPTVDEVLTELLLALVHHEPTASNEDLDDHWSYTPK